MLKARRKEISELFQRLGASRFHAHRLSELDPIDRRIFDIEKIKCCAARIGPDFSDLEFQDRVFAVREDYSCDIAYLYLSGVDRLFPLGQTKDYLNG